MIDALIEVAGGTLALVIVALVIYMLAELTERARRPRSTGEVWITDRSWTQRRERA